MSRMTTYKIEQELRNSFAREEEEINKDMEEILAQKRNLHEGCSDEVSAKLTSAFVQGTRYGRLKEKKMHRIVYDFPRRLLDASLTIRMANQLSTIKRKVRSRSK